MSLLINHPHYYLAYGSNMNRRQMRLRCPDAKVIGNFYLHNYELVFRGEPLFAVASIEPHKGSIVPCTLWTISSNDELALDRYEGWPRLYRKEIVQLTINSSKVWAMVYIMNPGSDYNNPSPKYRSTILEGYLEASFDAVLLDRAIGRSYRYKREHMRGLETMEKKKMDETVREQILQIRDSGYCNMFSINEVIYYANQDDLFELVSYLSDNANREEYCNFILYGDDKD